VADGHQIEPEFRRAGVESGTAEDDLLLQIQGVVPAVAKKPVLH
jgi:hypothetical protein